MDINFFDPVTKWGWTIKSRQDIITALMGYEAFATVDRAYIADAVDQAAQDSTEYFDIESLAIHILKNYI